MAEVDEKKLKELRKAFPAGTVGKLPKPYKSDSQKGNCQECGKYHGLPAVHLDYVGHAAVTDRLLEVDPEWSWEPMATDEDGLPKTDKAGNLWIRLTVLGITRIGVGDGNNAKECIGDALRNAAMRFGVALDLWSKEELESGIEDSSFKNEKPDAPKQSEPPRISVPASGKPLGSEISLKQLGMIKTLFSELEMTDGQENRDFVSDVVGHKVEALTELTKAEGVKVIDHLLAKKEGGQ